MFKTILVPIDVSHTDSGEAGLKAAVELAGDSGAKLILINVTSDVPNLVASQLPEGYSEKAQAEAKKALEQIAAGHGLASGSYEIRTTHGNTYVKILEAAKKDGADLIVVGSHQPEFSDYLLGSTAAKIVRHAHCSVLVVRS